MAPRETEREIRDLRRGRDRGLGEEGRTTEEQDRAMTPERGSEEVPRSFGEPDERQDDGTDPAPADPPRRRRRSAPG